MTRLQEPHSKEDQPFLTLRKLIHVGLLIFFKKGAKNHNFLATKLQYVVGMHAVCFFFWLIAVIICPWWPMASMDKTPPLHVNLLVYEGKNGHELLSCELPVTVLNVSSVNFRL